jgi:chemotaxis protein methyltransferase CheR
MTATARAAQQGRPASAGPSASGREFDFSARDFERVRKLIYQHAGISLNDSKSNMVYSRLARRLRALGLERFEDYLGMLERDEGGEREAFINSLTTNLTSFFREPHHFPLLAQLLKSLPDREIHLWCSAASTGEEPYTMAMTALDALGTRASRVRILASDIDTQVLERGARGVYSLDAVARLDRDLVRRHFLRGSGSQEGFVRVRQEVRALVSFQRINLLDASWPLRQRFDAIFCRNVMIYFDKPTQHGILKKFAPLLAPGGRLFAGHSENLSFARDVLAPCGRTVYGAVRDMKEGG